MRVKVPDALAEAHAGLVESFELTALATDEEESDVRTRNVREVRRWGDKLDALLDRAWQLRLHWRVAVQAEALDRGIEVDPCLRSLRRFPEL